MKKVIKIFAVMTLAGCVALCSCGKEDNSGNVGVDESTTETNETIAESTTTVMEDEGLTKISTTTKLVFNGGKFQGWGTGIAWWGNRLGYSDTLTEQAIKLFFDEETGLGMNIVRYNIPGGDDPTHTHITRTDTKMQGFTYYNEETGEYEFDKTVNPNQRNVLFKIKEFCGDKLIAEAYTCSPPYYMTESGCTSGSDKGITNNLKDEYYDDYAAYIAEVLRIYRDEYDFVFDGISPVNEPTSDRWIEKRTPHEACRIDRGGPIGNLFKALLEALDEKEFTTGTMDVSIDGEGDLGVHQPFTEIKNIVTKVNLHTGSELSHSYARNADFAEYYAEGRGKNGWITEGDSNLKHSRCKGDMSAALWFAQKIISDVGGYIPAAWMIENAIDYHICAEGYQGNQDTGMPDTTQGYWGLAVADHDSEQIILTKKYYAYGQFSRYIRPGYTIFADNNDDVLVTYSPDEKKLVIVAVNNAEAETELKISLEAFDYAGGTAKVIRTSGELEGGENWAEIPDVEVAKDVFRTGLKGYSITTFIIDGVEIKK